MAECFDVQSIVEPFDDGLRLVVAVRCSILDARIRDLLREVAFRIERLQTGDLDALEGWVAERPVVSASETEPSFLWLAVKDLTDEQRKRVLDAVALRDMRGES